LQQALVHFQRGGGQVEQVLLQNQQRSAAADDEVLDGQLRLVDYEDALGFISVANVEVQLQQVAVNSGEVGLVIGRWWWKAACSKK
jgi:hypothetical protein